MADPKKTEEKSTVRDLAMIAKIMSEQHIGRPEAIVELHVQKAAQAAEKTAQPNRPGNDADALAEFNRYREKQGLAPLQPKLA